MKSIESISHPKSFQSIEISAEERKNALPESKKLGNPKDVIDIGQAQLKWP